MHSFDANIRFTLSKLLNGSITDLAQRQASLLFRLGDTGVSCFHFILQHEDLLNNTPPLKDISVAKKITGKDEAISLLEQLICKPECFSESNLQSKPDNLHYTCTMYIIHTCIIYMYIIHVHVDYICMYIIQVQLYMYMYIIHVHYTSTIIHVHVHYTCCYAMKVQIYNNNHSSSL